MISSSTSDSGKMTLEEKMVLDVHSPLPWKTCTMAGTVRIENIERLQHVAVLPTTGPHSIKDAKAIVKAVNHYEALTQALEKMVNGFTETTSAEQETALSESRKLLSSLRQI